MSLLPQEAEIVTQRLQKQWNLKSFVYFSEPFTLVLSCNIVK